MRPVRVPLLHVDFDAECALVNIMKRSVSSTRMTGPVFARFRIDCKSILRVESPGTDRTLLDEEPESMLCGPALHVVARMHQDSQGTEPGPRGRSIASVATRARPEAIFLTTRTGPRPSLLPSGRAYLHFQSLRLVRLAVTPFSCHSLSIMVFAFEKCLWLALFFAAVFVVAAPTPVELGITNLLQSDADSTSPFAIFGAGVAPFGSLADSSNDGQSTSGDKSSDTASDSAHASATGSSSKPEGSDTSSARSTAAVPSQSADISAIRSDTFASESTAVSASAVSSLASGSLFSSGTLVFFGLCVFR
ncbi:hypothetical protein DAEQUDRAFT_106403 [Daedalea quercina L-15889]|uniref:Uncharacterized protein n=1 Tax=Daedalea quercina L-15889 TaxID=1314783 RepID=A0A165S255_9APHY|nr:hypothetical protein DAEQUDRAFT_106403 [Daedalea quercina L-15889]